MSKSKTILLGLFLLSFLVPNIVFAQSFTGQDSSSGQSYGASSQSDFQNAGFQQSGSSAATTAAGSADALRQATNQTITVSGAPANQPIANEQSINTTKVLLWTLFGFSLVGMAVMYLVQRKSASTTKNTDSNVTEDTAVVATKQSKSKKTKKKSTKKKRTHR